MLVSFHTALEKLHFIPEYLWQQTPQKCENSEISLKKRKEKKGQGLLTVNVFYTAEKTFQWCQSDTNPRPGAHSENADVLALEDLGEPVSRRDNGATLSESHRVSGQHFSALRL